MTKTIEIGTKVRDESGFIGVVQKINEYEGRFWYDVKFDRGVAVRYPEELEVVS